MSDRVSPSPVTVQQIIANDSLLSPQFILAAMLIIVAGGTIAAVFIKGDTAVQNVVAGTVIGTALGSITSFYFGSSKGSQNKDAILAAQQTPPQTTEQGAKP